MPPIPERSRRWIEEMKAFREQIPTIVRAVSAQEGQIPSVAQQLQDELEGPLKDLNRELLGIMFEGHHRHGPNPYGPATQEHHRYMMREYDNLKMKVSAIIRTARSYPEFRRSRVLDAERRAIAGGDSGSGESNLQVWDPEGTAWQDADSKNIHTGYEDLDVAITFIHSLRALQAHELKDDDHTCGICQGDYFTGDNPEVPKELPCKHHLGDHCLTHWVFAESKDLNNTCPLCRDELFRRGNRKTLGEALRVWSEWNPDDEYDTEDGRDVIVID